MSTKNENVSSEYISKHNSNREKQVILLMISNREKREAKSEGQQWHYLVVKKLSALLRGIMSKHYSDFYCLNCLKSFRTKNKLELHKRKCGNKDFVDVIMPSEDTKLLEFNQYQKI